MPECVKQGPSVLLSLVYELSGRVHTGSVRLYRVASIEMIR